MTDLKKCPFCGRFVGYICDAAGDPYGVHCPHCHMITKFTRVKPPGPHEEFERVMNDIAERWNRREGQDG